MVRPCFLVVDREFEGSISTRKLVIETAKFNVITAYSFDEALETLEQFPRVHCVVVGASSQISCKEFTTKVRARFPEMKIVATGNADEQGHGPVDRVIEGYSPVVLLETLRQLFPTETAGLQQHERELEAD